MDRPPQYPVIDSIASLWTELREHLQERFRQLSLEIRHYPTPIAHCDDQLPKLIEQRDHARIELERIAAIDAASSDAGGTFIRALERFVEIAPPTDDDAELALRSRLRNVLSAPKRKPQLARPPSLHISEWK